MSLSLCKKCGGPRGLGRRLCKECRKVQARKCAKDSYIRRGGHKKHKHTCPLCKTHFETSRASSTFCTKCRRKRGPITGPTNPYIWTKEGWEHKVIAEKYIGRALKYREVVHHINGDPKDNTPKNISVFTLSAHGSLHSFLVEMTLIHKSSKCTCRGTISNIEYMLWTKLWSKVARCKIIFIE